MDLFHPHGFLAVSSCGLWFGDPQLLLSVPIIKARKNVTLRLLPWSLRYWPPWIPGFPGFWKAKRTTLSTHFRIFTIFTWKFMPSTFIHTLGVPTLAVLTIFLPER
jgi:hypothetical protein